MIGTNFGIYRPANAGSNTNGNNQVGPVQSTNPAQEVIHYLNISILFDSFHRFIGFTIK